MKFIPLKSALCIATGFTTLVQVASAQVNISQAPHNKPPALSWELYRQEHYAVSGQTAADGLTKQDRTVASQNASAAEKEKFVVAASAVNTDAKDAAHIAENTLNSLVNPSLHQRLAYNLAKYYFRKDKFADAIRYYEQAGVNNLDNDEVGDQKFELAYCYFNNQQFDKARPLFSYIKDLKDTRYYMAGNYYYGLLCYNENKYNDALRSFYVVKNEKEYKSYVPYYIAEIWYFKGDRAHALSLTDSLISAKDKSFYHKELHLLAAQCLFESQEYARARPYFEYYYKNVSKINKADLYKMAYTYYRLSEWNNATDKFKMLSNAQDSLGQTSMYLLGDCYLKTDNRQSARNAFGLCADMNYNKAQQEAAMILYARLSYESGKDDEALRMVNLLLNNYPDSKYADEARTLKSDLLLKTNQYEEAIKLLQHVQSKDEHFSLVNQKTNYGFAVQQYKKGDLKKADEYFAKSLATAASPEYERAAYFWRGEIAYHDKRYSDAITYSQNFISRTGNIQVVEKISPHATVPHAYVNMGYAAMETGNYVAAQDFFSQARLSASGDRRSEAAATVLEADAVFLQKNYAKALTQYEKILAAGGADADYARFQKAVIMGLLGRNSEKLTQMQEISRAKPASAYALNARYEIAVTQIEMESYKASLSSLRYLYDSATDKSYASKALMKAGFAWQQLNDNNNAIAAYRRVVTEHPGAEERFGALEALKGLYIQANQPGKYAQLLSEMNLPSGDSTAIESAYYAAGESQYAAGRWQDARQAFSDYLLHYPHGISAVKAHYYLAECYFKQKKYAEAREHYNAVLETPWNDFSENSARQSAAIALDMKEYDDAYQLYKSLHTNSAENSGSEYIYRGLMKSAFHTARYAEAGMFADTLLTDVTTTADGMTEAKFYTARSLEETGKADDALTAYEETAGARNGEIAAESRYHISAILLQKGKLKEAEKAANETIKLSAGYSRWVDRSYLVLADILIKQKEYFDARSLLQGIAKGSKIPELKQEAARRLEEVKKLEKQQSKLSED